MATSRYKVVLEPDERSGFTVLVPSLPRVVTQGETIQEALENVRDAIALTLASDGPPPGARDQTEVFTIEVASA